MFFFEYFQVSEIKLKNKGNAQKMLCSISSKMGIQILIKKKFWNIKKICGNNFFPKLHIFIELKLLSNQLIAFLKS